MCGPSWARWAPCQHLMPHHRRMPGGQPGRPTARRGAPVRSPACEPNPSLTLACPRPSTLQMAVSTVSASRSGSVRCRHAAALRPRIMTRRTSRGEGAASGRPPAAAAAASAAPALSARSASIWSSACSRPLRRAAVTRVRVGLTPHARRPPSPAPTLGPCGARRRPRRPPQQRHSSRPCSASITSSQSPASPRRPAAGCTRHGGFCGTGTAAGPAGMHMARAQRCCFTLKLQA